jgi:hypothetical protein
VDGRILARQHDEPSPTVLSFRGWRTLTNLFPSPEPNLKVIRAQSSIVTRCTTQQIEKRYVLYADLTD